MEVRVGKGVSFISHIQGSSSTFWNVSTLSGKLQSECSLLFIFLIEPFTLHVSAITFHFGKPTLISTTLITKRPLKEIDVSFWVELYIFQWRSHYFLGREQKKRWVNYRSTPWMIKTQPLHFIPDSEIRILCALLLECALMV